MKFIKIAFLIFVVVASYQLFKGSTKAENKKTDKLKIAAANPNKAETPSKTEIKTEKKVAQNPEKTESPIKTTAAYEPKKQVEKTKESKTKKEVANNSVKSNPKTKTPRAYKFVGQSEKAAEKNSPKQESETTKESGPKLAKTESSTKENSAPKKVRDRTQGHYLGASYNYVRTNFHEEYTYSEVPTNSKLKPSSANNGYGFGLNYKYAFNFNKFYIAPGILWEKFYNKVEGAQANDPYFDRYGDLVQLDARYRYGITSDFGYDFNKFLSSYILFGYVATGLRVQNGVADDRDRYVSTSVDRLDKNFLFGGGFNFKISDQVSLNLEANTQKFRVSSDVPSAYALLSNMSGADYNSLNVKSGYVGRINVFKIGLSYNF